VSLTAFGPRDLLIQVFSRLTHAYVRGEDLHERFGDLSPTQAADQILNAYAHELAEEIRKEADADTDWVKGVGNRGIAMEVAADLIDHEVE
jgi:hypothetical protein